MTGVQTCALPICDRVPMATDELHAASMKPLGAMETAENYGNQASVNHRYGDHLKRETERVDRDSFSLKYWFFFFRQYYTHTKKKSSRNRETENEQERSLPSVYVRDHRASWICDVRCDWRIFSSFANVMEKKWTTTTAMTNYADAFSDAASWYDGRERVNSMGIDFCLSLTFSVCSSPISFHRQASAWQRCRSNYQILEQEEFQRMNIDGAGEGTHPNG